MALFSRDMPSTKPSHHHPPLPCPKEPSLRWSLTVFEAGCGIGRLRLKVGRKSKTSSSSQRSLVRIDFSHNFVEKEPRSTSQLHFAQDGGSLVQRSLLRLYCTFLDGHLFSCHSKPVV